MAWDLSNLECTQSKPFDLRRERRGFYRYWKRHPTSKRDKRAHCLHSVRQFTKVLMDQYDAQWAE